jgi:hypothetical protein
MPGPFSRWVDRLRTLERADETKVRPLGCGVSHFLGGLKSRTLPPLTVLLISQGAAPVVVAVIMASIGAPQLGGEFMLFASLAGTNLGTTSIYPQGIDPGEIIATVPTRRAPMMSPAPAASLSGRPDHQRERPGAPA